MPFEKLLFTHQSIRRNSALDETLLGRPPGGGAAEKSDPDGDSIAFAPKIDVHARGAEASNESRLQAFAGGCLY
jgi:hypothetical protein